jgi:hypothetical protein
MTNDVLAHLAQLEVPPGSEFVHRHDQVMLLVAWHALHGQPIARLLVTECHTLGGGRSESKSLACHPNQNLLAGLNRSTF